MGEDTGFLPGCYCNLPQVVGESLRGYLLRLGEANGYAGAVPLLMLAMASTQRRPESLYREFLSSHDALAAMGRIAIGDASHLLKHLVVPLDDGALIHAGLRIDDDALLNDRAQVCAGCLAEQKISREEWDLSTVTACFRHGTRLMDCCHACGVPISWTRPSLLRCDHCGADFRAATPEPISPEEVNVAGDFAALAPFRFHVRGDAVEVLTWDGAFRLFKCLALTRAHWAMSEYPSRFLRDLPVERRHAAIELLANARMNGTYRLERMVGHVRGLLQPVAAIPKPFLLEQTALSLLQSEVGLPPSIAEALVSEYPMKAPPKGYEIFHGRPPAMVNLSDVALFLGVDTPTMSSLVRSEKLLLPGSGESFDIDDVLDAQRFLHDGLLTIPEQRMIVGVPLQLGDSVQDWFLETWNRAISSDKRVEVVIFLRIQRHLLAKFDESTILTSSISFGSVAALTSHPASTLIRGVMWILNGTISRFNWNTPFRWSDLEVEESAAKAMLAGAELVSGSPERALMPLSNQSSAKSLGRLA